jgi:hypothetical protein
MLSTGVSTMTIQKTRLPLYVAINLHATLLRLVLIFGLVEVDTLNIRISQLDYWGLLISGPAVIGQMIVGALVGVAFGLLASIWTKKIVRDNLNLIQLVLGSFLILFSFFSYFPNVGSRFSALISFTLTIKVSGFSKYKFESRHD